MILKAPVCNSILSAWCPCSQAHLGGAPHVEKPERDGGAQAVNLANKPKAKGIRYTSSNGCDQPIQ